MSLKPGTLAVLKKGKIIDTVDHLVDTLNWVISFCDNLKGEGDIEVDTKISDHPKIKFSLETEEIEVVLDVAYDESTHTMTKKTKKLKVLKVNGAKESTSSVFIATPHIPHEE